jgi:hypothetical protein
MAGEFVRMVGEILFHGPQVVLIWGLVGMGAGLTLAGAASRYRS